MIMIIVIKTFNYRGYIQLLLVCFLLDVKEVIKRLVRCGLFVIGVTEGVQVIIINNIVITCCEITNLISMGKWHSQVVTAL